MLADTDTSRERTISLVRLQDEWQDELDAAVQRRTVRSTAGALSEIELEVNRARFELVESDLDDIAEGA